MEVCTKPPERLAYSIPQLVAASGLGRSTIYLALAEGRLRARKVGRRTLVLAEDARAFLQALPEASAGGGGRAA